MSASLVPFLFDVVSYTAIFLLIVAGLGVIASMMGIFNFAHGEFLLLGAYTVYLAESWNIPGWCAMVAAPVLVGLVGLLLERTIIRHFYAAPVSAMLGTYAIGMALRETVRVLLGGQFYSVPSPADGSFLIGDIAVSRWRAILVVVSIAVLVACYLMVAKTRLGLRVRASLENASLARASGISTDHVYAGTFAFGAALAGLAGALVVPIYPLNADLGVAFLIKSFLAVMLGGLGTLEGSLVGAAAVGATGAALPWAINAVVADMLVFLIAIAIVKYRPQGLMSSWRK
jgi:branched-chain amino acid transport system permease protein